MKKRTLEEIINEECANLGINKTQLAEKVGYSTSHFTNISNGRGTTRKTGYRPDPVLINRLAFHLKVPIEELLESLGFELSKDRDYLSAEMTAFVEDFEKLSEPIKKQVSMIMSSVIELLQKQEAEIINKLDKQTVSATINGKEFKMRFLEPIEKLNEVLVTDE